MKVPESTLKLDSKMTFGIASITRNFLAIIGNEYFYHFIGKQGGICLSEWVHPDYKEEFINTCNTVPAGHSARIVILMRDFNEDYHLIDMTISNNEQIISGEPVLNLLLYNITAIENRHIRSLNELTKYRSFLSLYQDYLLDYDSETEIFTIYIYMGSKSTQFIKCKADEFYQLITKDFTDPQHLQEFDEFYNQLIEAKKDFTSTLNLPLPKDLSTVKPFTITCKIIYKFNKRPMVIGTIKPASADANKVVPYYTTKEGRDAATGLFNKRACHEFTTEMLNLRDGNRHYMAIIDVDNFKEINDTYGHLFGDEVLLNISKILRTTLNSRGICGRFGGDEFYIFTNNIRDERQLRDFLTAMRKELKFLYEGVVENFTVTLSIGISMYPNDGETYDELFKKADKCLYLAKNRGRNRFILYNKELHGDFEEDSKVLRYTFNPLERAEFLAIHTGELSAKLSRDGINALPDVLTDICTSFEIDGVRIYTGSNAELTWHTDTYKKLPDISRYLNNDDFVKCYNKYNVIVCNKIMSFEVHHKELINATADCHIMAMLSFYYTKEDGTNIFFFYDVFNHATRWNESDKNYLLSLSTIIASLL